MIAALLRRDSVSAETWLSFSRPPPEDVRAHLKASGWRYDGSRRSWRHASTTPPIPLAVAIAEAPPEPLSTYRPLNGNEILAVLARAKAVLAAQLATHRPAAAAATTHEGLPLVFPSPACR